MIGLQLSFKAYISDCGIPSVTSSIKASSAGDFDIIKLLNDMTAWSIWRFENSRLDLEVRRRRVP